MISCMMRKKPIPCNNRSPRFIVLLRNCSPNNNYNIIDIIKLLIFLCYTNDDSTLYLHHKPILKAIEN